MRGHRNRGTGPELLPQVRRHLRGGRTQPEGQLEPRGKDHRQRIMDRPGGRQSLDNGGVDFEMRNVFRSQNSVRHFEFVFRWLRGSLAGFGSRGDAKIVCSGSACSVASPRNQWASSTTALGGRTRSRCVAANAPVEAQQNRLEGIRRGLGKRETSTFLWQYWCETHL